MYSKRSHNKEIMSRHSGLSLQQNYITKASYYAYENALFITEDDITTFLQSALIKDTWTTTSRNLALWLPWRLNLWRVAVGFGLWSSSQVLICPLRFRNGHASLHVVKTEFCHRRTLRLTTAWLPLTTAFFGEFDWANRTRSISMSFPTCPCGLIFLKTPAI